MTMTLINAKPSPFGRKIAIAMLEKGLKYDVRYDVPWGAGTCTPEYSPVQQLPILIADDGEVVYDSPYILEWLDARFPTPALLPTGVDDRLMARKRQMLGERLMEFAQTLIFEVQRNDPSLPWVERQTRKVSGALEALESLYAERGYNEAIDLGDIATGTTLAILEFVTPAGLSPEIDAIKWRDRYPSLTVFADEIEKRPSFSATMPEPMDVDLKAAIA